MKEISTRSQAPQPFWHIPADELLSSLGTSLKGSSERRQQFIRRDMPERLRCLASRRDFFHRYSRATGKLDASQRQRQDTLMLLNFNRRASAVEYQNIRALARL